jgi:predicted nuclease with TOPRIM domain
MSGERFCSGCSRWILTKEEATEAVRQSSLRYEGKLEELRATLGQVQMVLTVREQTIAQLKKENEQLRKQYRDLQAGAASMDVDSRRVIPQKMWKKLASLVHPDRHDGSKVATEVMQWLLEHRR